MLESDPQAMLKTCKNSKLLAHFSLCIFSGEPTGAEKLFCKSPQFQESVKVCLSNHVYLKINCSSYSKGKVK